MRDQPHNNEMELTRSAMAKRRGPRSSSQCWADSGDMIVRRIPMLFIAVGLAAAPAPSNAVECALDSARHGQLLIVRGEVFPTAHDLLVAPEGCPGSRVILVYGDDSSVRESGLVTQKDAAFSQYENYLRERWPVRPNEHARENYRYRVAATFTGRLDVAASAGLMRDPPTGKVIGVEGFGHPMPFSRYRLVMTSVADVVARERLSPNDADHQPAKPEAQAKGTAQQGDAPDEAPKRTGALAGDPQCPAGEVAR